MTPEALVEVIVGGSAPCLGDWEKARSDLAAHPDGALDGIRADLQREQFRRWAAAIVLARLGAADGDDLALAVLREMDWNLIPGQGFNFWEQAAWHVRDALSSGRRPDVEMLAISALERADLGASEWTEVVDEAIGLLEWTSDPQAVEVLTRVASEHWNAPGRDHATAILGRIDHPS